MGLYEFNLLQQNKWSLFIVKLFFLTNRIEKPFGLSLYRLFDFFVEVSLNNEIERVRTFKSIEPLAPYLDELDLDRL